MKSIVKSAPIFQERFLLTLDSDPTSKLTRRMLKSPLGLSHKVVQLLFDNKFTEVRTELDSIKEFVAGVTRAERLGEDYTLAKFYPNLFAFHQFFHSSYRARQGKTLEEALKELLREADSTLNVPDELEAKQKAMAAVFKGYSSKKDIDVVAKKDSDIMVIQLRSNVNTGGTTAKSSLVELLAEIMSLKRIEGSSLVYHVAVWEPEGSQKKITKDKFYSLLERPLKEAKIDKSKFLSHIENGILIGQGITLKLSFGTEEILKSIKNWLGADSKLKDSAIIDLTKRMEEWDDLWLAYAIASVELETKMIRKFDNIGVLNKLLSKVRYNTKKFNKSEEFVTLANELVSKIMPLWKEPSIPFDSPSDKIHYIRDLILLKFIYDSL
jgi:hypothetical protein